MRESRFLIILIVISIFAILVSVFFFLRSKNNDNNDGINSETVIQDDFEDGTVSVNKEVTNYTDNNEEVSENLSSESSAINTETSSEIVYEKDDINVVANTSSQSNKGVPNIPTLTSSPYSTSKDSENIEINGEPNAEIFVNDWSIGNLDSNGKKTVALNTAGGDGDKSFSIFLRNSFGKSGILNLVIKKQTTISSFTSSTTSSSTSTGSFKGKWAYVYTNKQKFDIDDYKDDDIDELRLSDVCKDNRGTYTYCYKTSRLDDGDNSELGNTKCPTSCSKGQTCLLWNKKGKSSGSLYSWVAMYRCE